MDIKEIFTYNTYSLLYELNYKDLIKKVDKRIKRTAKERQVGVYLNDFDPLTKEIIFDAPGTYNPDIHYKVRIKLLDFDKYIFNKEEKLRDRVKKILKGDIAIHCTCPAFTYWGYKYIAWNDGYGIEPEYIPPDIRNPNREGSVCKHALWALRVLLFNVPEITKLIGKYYE